MPEGSQHGAKIDTKIFQKSMPKLVMKKIRKIIKNHVSMKGKIIEIHWKNFFWWFRRLHVRTVKVKKNIKKETNIHPKIDEQSIQKSCSKKGYPKDETSSKKWSKKDVKSGQKLEEKNREKIKRKEETTRQSGRSGPEAGTCRTAHRTLKVQDRT